MRWRQKEREIKERQYKLKTSYATDIGRAYLWVTFVNVNVLSFLIEDTV